MLTVSLGRLLVIPALLALAVAGCGRSGLSDAPPTDPGTVTILFQFPTQGPLSAGTNYGGYGYFDLTWSGALEQAGGGSDSTGETSATTALTVQKSELLLANSQGLVIFGLLGNLKWGSWAFDISVGAGPNHEHPMQTVCVNVLVRSGKNTTVKFAAGENEIVTCTFQVDG